MVAAVVVGSGVRLVCAVVVDCGSVVGIFSGTGTSRSVSEVGTVLAGGFVTSKITI